MFYAIFTQSVYCMMYHDIRFVTHQTKSVLHVPPSLRTIHIYQVEEIFCRRQSVALYSFFIAAF